MKGSQSGMSFVPQNRNLKAKMSGATVILNEGLAG